jgi:hypothetical protein
MSADRRREAYALVLGEYRGCAGRSRSRDTRLLGILAILTGYLQAIRDTRSPEGMAETLIGVSEALDEILAAEVTRL